MAAIDDASSVGNRPNVGPSGVTVNTPYETKDELISVDSFLQLMIKEMTTPNFFGDDSGGGGSSTTDYITQLAQITTMQQMQQLAYYSKSNYAMSLIGKDVTVASLGLGAQVDKITGPVEKVALVDGDFTVYVGGNGYSLSQIMSVNNPQIVSDDSMDKIANTAVVLTSRSTDWASIRWDPPDVEEENLEKLTYSVYYSTSSAMDEVSDIKKGTLVQVADADDEYQMKITGLEPGTKYYVNVIVNTPDGKQYPYEKLIFTTKE